MHVCACLYSVTRTGVQSKFPGTVLNSLIRSLQWLGPGFTKMTEDGLWIVRVQDSTGDGYLEMCFSLSSWQTISLWNSGQKLPLSESFWHFPPESSSTNVLTSCFWLYVLISVPLVNRWVPWGQRPCFPQLCLHRMSNSVHSGSSIEV